MAGASTPAPRRTLLWTGLALVALAGAAVAVEAAGLARYALRHGGLYYTRTLEPPPGEAPQGPRATRRTAFHPYFGFVAKPGTRLWRGAGPPPAFTEGADPARPPAWTATESNNLGFYSSLDYPVHDADALLVGVFGGSLAHNLVIQGGRLLEEELSRAAGGRPVRVLNFASGGYKQPQQLLILAYFLSIGQRLDAVLNVDGFNEVAIGASNEPLGLDASMPGYAFVRGLEVLAGAPRDPAALRYLLEVETLRERERRLAEARRRAPLAALHWLADVRHARTRERLRALAAEPPPPGDRRLLVLAPPLSDAGAGADLGARIAATWARASLLMHELAGEAGAAYVHVLQPNQYVGGHPFGEAERRRALNPASPYRAPAIAHYPALRARAAALREQGVRFHDATALFDDVHAPVYADDCCHLNQRGNDLLARRAAALLAEALPARPPAAGAPTP